ncbi:MAG: prolyl oligopeptidase family serine peptidase [Ignavibacteriae bacterium]|nr:prolyl oligopeptidase family serine peptidase [Ignavibacteriota bacterium]
MVKIKPDYDSLKLIEKGWGKSVSDYTDNFKFRYDSEGFMIDGYISCPKNIDGKLPVIIWNRGGNDKSGRLDDFLASGILGEIASWGYIVFASQYRDKDEFGGRDLNDVLNLIKIAKQYEHSDSERIGMEGWSRGGMMSYLALTKTDEIKTCIIVAGLSDLISNENQNPKLGKVFQKNFGNEDKKKFLEEKVNRSAVCWPEKISKITDILLIHGTSDEKVLSSDSVSLYNKISALNGKEKYALNLIEGGDHYLRKNRKEVSVMRKKWFDERLKFKRF